MASRCVWCIFQLPEIKGLRSGIAGLSERFEAGEITLLDELERSAAAGRDVVDVAVEAELLQRAGAVTTADNGEAAAVGYRVGDGAGAGCEPFVLEHAHRTIPEDGASVVDDVGELGRRPG